MIVSMLGGLAGQVIGLFGQKGKASQENIKARMDNMKRSWTDEFIAVYWFSPSIMAWFNPEKAELMITVMMSNTEMVAIQVAITAAVFGLGKVKGRK